MIYHICGCNFDEAKEILEVCLKRAIQKKKDWDEKLKKERQNKDNLEKTKSLSTKALFPNNNSASEVY